MYPFLLLALCSGAPALVDFGAPELALEPTWNHTSRERIEHEDASVSRVTFEPAPWPNVMFRASEPWDWSGYSGIVVELFNPGDDLVHVNLRIDNEGANGTDHCNTCRTVATPGRRTELRCIFHVDGDERLWGMRGLPGTGPVGSGAVLDTSAITSFQIFLNHPEEDTDLLIYRVRLFGNGPRGEPVEFPFVDEFGQYREETWPGKLENAGELQRSVQAESEQLWRKDAEQPHPWPFKDRDRYGGWQSGPRSEATGWFRTEHRDGKWWLVTPTGSLFLSIGVDCVGYGQRTYVSGREDWFEWLPAREDERFRSFYGDGYRAHSMAERIGSEGSVFGFYAANLLRKYGDHWQTRWRETCYRRLQVWGFNTVGNWSQRDVLLNSPLPFVASSRIADVPPIAGARGHWAAMFDVYDDSFPVAAAASAARAAGAYANNPLCIGYFIDNELAWNGVTEGVLKSPARQPARKKLIELLRDRYESIEHLNAAWESTFASWDTIGDVGRRCDAMQADLDEYLFRFAKTYFKTIADALDAVAPNQLYLGCRFSNQPEPVVRACAAHVDVVSYNRYVQEVDCGTFDLPADRGKPVIIGEFHFGALDRGMFHGGLVPVENQAQRAAAYQRYWRSVASCPVTVGAHWFQFVDEPITGRYFDGENYNIGFVDVTDTPYPALRDAAVDVHAELYGLRHPSE